MRSSVPCEQAVWLEVFKTNRRQKVILIVAIAITAIMLLFPPWYTKGTGEHKDVKFYRGYHFLSTPPCCAPRIDYPRLIWPIAVVCFMALLAFLELATPKTG